MVEAAQSVGEPHRHLRHEPLDSVTTAVVNTALFALKVPFPLADGLTFPLAIEDHDVRWFLCWKLAQDGGSDVSLLGRPYDTERQTWLPVTGAEAFVPLFGTEFSGVHVADALAFEDLFGILTAVAHRSEELRHMRPRTLALQQIARIGARALSTFEHPLEDACASILRGHFLDAALSLRVVEQLAAFFGEFVAIAHAFDDTHHGGAPAFRDETPSLVRPDLAYTVENGCYVRCYVQPVPTSGPAEAPDTPLTLSEREHEGYHLMTRLGEFGDPLLRAALRVIVAP